MAISLELFTTIETYEDCPCGDELLVWTGDSFAVEYVEIDVETGTFYPANGTEFVAFLELPSQDESFKFFDGLTSNTK